MLRLAAAELRHRPGRAITLMLGLALSVAAFAVLSATTQSGRLEVRQTIAANYRTSYDILVRPKGSRTSLETQGLVRPAVASQIFGGITIAQWRQVQELAGVQIAAPIATVGYALPNVSVRVDVTDLIRRPARTVFRVRVRRSTDRGRSTQQDADTYLYVTSRRLDAPRAVAADPASAGPTEVQLDGSERKVCVTGSRLADPQSPFERSARTGIQGFLRCWSTKTGPDGRGARRQIVIDVPVDVPAVIAAIDPVQEARLSGLNEAILSGRALRPSDRPTRAFVPSVPVLVAESSPIDESAVVAVERLPARVGMVIATGSLQAESLRRALAREHGPTVRRQVIPSALAQRSLVAGLAAKDGLAVTAYWGVGATRYTEVDGALRPRPVRNDTDVWRSAADGGFAQTPLSARDPTFRELEPHEGTTAAQIGQVFALIHSIGTFDPKRIRAGADGLAAFTVPGLQPDDEASRTALGGRPLLPNGNLGGYQVQPPTLLTNLASLRAFQGNNYDAPAQAAPISIIRVRVAGVEGIDALSRERIRRTAEQIQQRTGLVVDLTAGSSPTTQTIQLPAGTYGRPQLRLREQWVRKGVALRILASADRKSLLLLALLLAVCGLAVANATSAAVAGRRTELAVLSCVGWPPSRLFALILTETAAIASAAGILGGTAALAVGQLSSVDVTVSRALLAVGLAILLAVLAAAVPALRAARVPPAQAVRPAVATGGRSRGINSVGQLASSNVLRTPGRSLLGALAVATATAATTIIVAIAAAFDGTLVDSTLGSVISVQVQSTDYAAVIGMLALSAFAVADVTHLGLQERAGELATLRSTGWDDNAIAHLARRETLLIAVAGSLAGASTGILLTSLIAGEIPALAIAAAGGACAVSVLSGLLAAVIPIRLAQRRAPAADLATI